MTGMQLCITLSVLEGHHKPLVQHTTLVTTPYPCHSCFYFLGEQEARRVNHMFMEAEVLLCLLTSAPCSV